MNGWTGTPGVPLNPERDGWHWVENKYSGDRRAAQWLTDLHWGLRVTVHEMAEACIYLCPVIPPEESMTLTARVAELEDLLSDACFELSSRIDDAFPERHQSPRDMQSYTAAMEITQRIRTALERNQDA